MSRPPVSLLEPVRPWVAGLVDALGLGLAGGFYAWILSSPRPADAAITRTTQVGLLAGLPLLVFLAQFGGFAFTVSLAGSPRARAWRARLALASCGLYLAAMVAAIGGPALVLAPLSALAWLVTIVVRAQEPRGSAVLLTLHASALGMALAFFHQWAWYRPAWAPFLENLGALRRLWFGS
jgi:hypothetical protein